MEAYRSSGHSYTSTQYHPPPSSNSNDFGPFHTNYNPNGRPGTTIPPTYLPPPPSLHHYPSSSSSHASRNPQPGPSRRPNNMDGILDDNTAEAPPLITNDPNFDIIDWYPAYQSCQRYFLDHAQHEPATQALCALINIRLPYQWLNNPITSSTPPQQQSNTPSSAQSNSQFTFTTPYQRPTNGLNSPHQNQQLSTQQASPVFISLLPYLRRLIITGFDKPPILHGFFGDSYKAGIAPHLDCERRNYLFSAKHGGWRTCKKQYDAGSGGGAAGDETAPFMKPLEDARGEELGAAEKAWSQWLAMEDWLVGERALEGEVPGGSQGSAGARERERERGDLPDRASR